MELSLRASRGSQVALIGWRDHHKGSASIRVESGGEDRNYGTIDATVSGGHLLQPDVSEPTVRLG